MSYQSGPYQGGQSQPGPYQPGPYQPGPGQYGYGQYHSGPPPDPTAVMGRRIGAYIIDFVLLAIIPIILVVGGTESGEVPGGFFISDACDVVEAETNDYYCIESDDGDGGTDVILVEKSAVSSATVVYWLSFAANFLVLQALTGASLGKLMLGLRVVRRTGERANFGQILVRSLFLLIDAFACFLVGLITALVSKGHRRVGDMVAGTYVVAASSVGTSPGPGGTGLGQPDAPPPWEPPPTAGWNPQPPPPPSGWAPPPGPPQ